MYKRHVESREDIALKIAHEKNYPLVKPFDNEDIIAGQGSFGLEACKFFKTNNIKPLWLNANFSWGWYDNVTDTWTGACGMIERDEVDYAIFAFKGTCPSLVCQERI